MAQTGPLMGLRLWNLLGDSYSHDQLKDNFYKLDLHDHSTGRGAPIGTSGLQDGAVTAAKLAPGANAIQDNAVTTATIADDAVTANKLDDTSVLIPLGLSGQGVPRSAKTIIPGSNSTSSTSYVALGTPDQATVTVQTDGLLYVAYLARWLVAAVGGSVSASAAIFVDGTQVKTFNNGLVNATEALIDQLSAGTSNPQNLVATAKGMETSKTPSGSDFTSLNTVPTIIGQTQSSGVEAYGNTCMIKVSGGSHTVSVRYKIVLGTGSSGTMTADLRHLWTWTRGF